MEPKRGSDSAADARLLEYLVHDLKTPLAGVLAAFHFIERHLEGEEARRFLHDGRAAAKRLERMLLDLLDVRRIEEGQLELERVAIPLDDLVEEALAAVRPQAMSRSVTLCTQLGEWASRLVEIDFDLMTRVLVNLVDNAVRHSPADSQVCVSAESNGAGFVLCVDDCGKGIPEAARQRIFEKFVRLDADAGDHGGRGLGLAFARLVAHAHDLDIGVQTSPRGGSRFYLHFPG